MLRHSTDTADPMAAFELELTRADGRARPAERRSPHPRYDGGIERIWRMTATERIAAMRAGELSLRQLAAWSARRPDEVPKLPFLGGQEFEWIVVTTPEWIEACETRQRDDEKAGR